MSEAKKRPSFGEMLTDIFTDKRLALMLALGFSSGLPFLLIYSTHSAWLAQANIPVTQIGLFSWVALAFSLKFLWAPIIDTRDLPLLTPLLGLLLPYTFLFSLDLQFARPREFFLVFRCLCAFSFKRLFALLLLLQLHLPGVLLFRFALCLPLGF